MLLLACKLFVLLTVGADLADSSRPGVFWVEREELFEKAVTRELPRAPWPDVVVQHPAADRHPARIDLASVSAPVRPDPRGWWPGPARRDAPASPVPDLEDQ
jgi:hypothetical protein